jgi:hypothetical protein
MDRKFCGTGRQLLTIKWQPLLLRTLNFQVMIGGRSCVPGIVPKLLKNTPEIISYL